MKTVCRTFNKILTMMAIDWEKCSNTKFSMLATVCNAKLSQRFANMTVIFYSIAVIFFSSKIFIKDDGKASNISTQLLILDMDLPFDVNQRFVYELVIIAQFFYLLLCADANCLLNALLINLVSNYYYYYYYHYYYYYDYYYCCCCCCCYCCCYFCCCCCCCCCCYYFYYSYSQKLIS